MWVLVGSFRAVQMWRGPATCGSWMRSGTRGRLSAPSGSRPPCRYKTTLTKPEPEPEPGSGVACRRSTACPPPPVRRASRWRSDFTREKRDPAVRKRPSPPLCSSQALTLGMGTCWEPSRKVAERQPAVPLHCVCSGSPPAEVAQLEVATWRRRSMGGRPHDRLLRRSRWRLCC